ncbi:TenA family transcriptional regulator [Actinoallomurus rhizosphaericola]|uniref:TenA family transcriptional regulator n=1 Tax=Actinoallomurus rhizosphaericola TaxID=2952536 RepID=UPI002092A525|nr:iron-containing redox enzyme family protein [Actinoallomurus rhizosphaericola]MCO5996955.1 iron-containing redox enzyme family protein [Actinoallomurus rhizosphaericola]
MSNFEKLLSATDSEFRSEIENNPLIELVLGGGMKREHYVSYLRETYHMVRHTSRMLSLAGARLGDEYRGLRDWFFDQVREENNHDLFCVNDLRNLGEDVDRVLAVPPMPGSWGLVAQNYYMATYGSPLGILGVASLTEGLGADLGKVIADTLRQQYGLERDQVTFIRSHGGFDARHIEDVKKAVDELLIGDSDLDEVIQGRRMTIHYYGQMFRDVMSATS